MPADKFMRYAALLFLVALPGTRGDPGGHKSPHHRFRSQNHFGTIYEKHVIRHVGSPKTGEMDLEERRQIAALSSQLSSLLFKFSIAIGILIGGLLYRCCGRDARLRSPTEMRQQPRDSFSENGFQFGLCECCHDCETSCWAIWCPMALWASSASSPKSKFWGWTFWQLTFLVAGFPFCMGISHLLTILLGIPMLSLLITLLVRLAQTWVLVRHRQHLRQKFDLVHDSCLAITEDACVWCYCIPCAAMQEALQVGFVEEMSLSAPLTDFPSQQNMLGEAVRVDGRQVFLQV